MKYHVSTNCSDFKKFPKIETLMTKINHNVAEKLCQETKLSFESCLNVEEGCLWGENVD